MHFVNRCAAGAVYIRFRLSFRGNKIHHIVYDRCSVDQNVNFYTCSFVINSHIFRHLELEVALAIPAPNDEKYN